LRVSRFASIDENNEYFRMIRSTWGERLRQVFSEIPDPTWSDPCAPGTLVPPSRVHQPRRLAPGGADPVDFAQPQVLAESPPDSRQKT
jgi:putative proteasome-type protease